MLSQFGVIFLSMISIYLSCNSLVIPIRDIYNGIMYLVMKNALLEVVNLIHHLVVNFVLLLLHNLLVVTMMVIVMALI